MKTHQYEAVYKRQVEAIEGTKNCIRRGGQLAGGKPATLAKVARQGHDMRFDIPTVGPATMETCAECGIRQVALEAGKDVYKRQIQSRRAGFVHLPYRTRLWKINSPSRPASHALTISVTSLLLAS